MLFPLLIGFIIFSLSIGQSELLDNIDCVKELQAARTIVEIMELKVGECFGEVSA